jgi:hypothetical protein
MEHRCINCQLPHEDNLNCELRCDLTTEKTARAEETKKGVGAESELIEETRREREPEKQQ